MTFLICSLLVLLCSHLPETNVILIIFAMYGSLSLVFLSSSFFKVEKDSFFSLISFLPLLISIPILENDFNRYFIEAYYFLKGIDIYNIRPSDYFTYKAEFLLFYKNFGFPEVPSIYGPMTHLFHGFFVSFFPSEWILYGLKFFYWLILLFFLRRVKLISTLFVFFLWSEFVNSVHIDALVVFFFVLGIHFANSKQIAISALLFLLSSLMKATVLLFIPFVVVAYFNLKKVSTYLFLLLLTILAYFYFNLDSVSVFLSDWIWNPGFIKFISLEYRHVGFAFVGIVFLFFIFQSQQFKRENLNLILGLVSLAHLLLSFTVNAWYLIYPLIFFNMSGRKGAMGTILLAWPLCYAPWSSQQDFVKMSNVLFHLMGWSVFFYESFISLNLKLSKMNDSTG